MDIGAINIGNNGKGMEAIQLLYVYSGFWYTILTEGLVGNKGECIFRDDLGMIFLYSLLTYCN